MARIDDIVRWAGVFVPPGQTTELRVLGTGGEVWAGWFRGDDLRPLAEAALAVEPKARGIYFVPNPVKTPAVPLGVVERRGRGQTTPDEAVVRRRWLLVDIDATRFGPDGRPLADNKCPATAAEREAAWQVVCRSKGGLEAFGLTGGVVGDSGNGWHLCYPIDMPNDDESRTLCRTVLAGLQARGGDERAHVDVATFNAARIWKLYGTRPRKGDESSGREHRYSYLARLPDAPGDPAANTAALRRAVGIWAKQDALRRPAEGAGAAAYAQKALEAEVGRVATAPPGGRNNALNAAAFSLGQLVGGGCLAREAVEASLTAAAVAAGLPRGEVVGTVRSGIEAGLKEPRTPPDRPAPGGSRAVATTATGVMAEAGGETPGKPTAVKPWAVRPPGNAPEGISAVDLWKMEFPPIEFVLDGLMGDGLTVLGGRPKSGKSWLALLLAWAVAGGKAVDGRPVAQGDVLYLALEDNFRRLQNRMRKLHGDLKWDVPARLTINVAWPRAGDGGLHWIAEWLEARRGTARLVIVDVLQRFRKPQKGSNSNSYADDYEAVGGLKELVDHYETSALFLHHTRKLKAEDPFDELSGTYGISGPADTLWMLDTVSHAAKLYARGRDIAECTTPMTYTRDSGRWVLGPTAEGLDTDGRNDPTKPKGSEKVVACATWLKEFLKTYAYPSAEIQAAATAEGYTASALRDAKLALGKDGTKELVNRNFGAGGNNDWWSGLGDSRLWKRRPETGPPGESRKSG